MGVYIYRTTLTSKLPKTMTFIPSYFGGPGISVRSGYRNSGFAGSWEQVSLPVRASIVPVFPVLVCFRAQVKTLTALRDETCEPARPSS